MAATGLAACGGSGSPSKPARATPPPSASAAVVPDAPAVARPARRADDVRTPQLRHLQAAVVGALAPDGGSVGVLIEDLVTGQVLFTRAAGIGRPPASVEKLYTSTAALSLLGPDTRLHTDVLGAGELEPGGVWHGDLYLRGDGDPTFGDGTFNRLYEDGYGPTAAQLVAQLRRDGIRRVAGFLVADESRFDDDRGGPATNNQPDIPDYGGELSALVYDHGATAKGYTPATFAANEVALTARAQGIGLFAFGSGRTPGGARLLATVASPPLSVLIRLMDVPSDDLFADLLAKQVGYRFFGRGTLTMGAIEIGQDIAAHYGIEPTILDGSGLDKSDRSSPEQIVSLLRQLWGTPIGQDVQAALPVVGETGTVRGIGVHTAAQGHCEAKTGTLNYVSNLAGWCSATDGHTLAFAVMIDGPSNWQAFGALAKVVAAIAAY